jgi:hypothetical protein
MDSTPSAPGSPANEGFIDLDVLSGTATDSVLVWSDHTGAQLVQNLKGRLVSGNPKLSLKLSG